MSLCVLSAGKLLALGVSAFTLAWTHSVEKTRWEEDWALTQQGLVVTEARVQGSGAGMDPPENARFDGTWWRYKPAVPPIPELLLANSGVAGAWTVTTTARTYEVGSHDAVIAACPKAPA